MEAVKILLIGLLLTGAHAKSSNFGSQPLIHPSADVPSMNLDVSTPPIHKEIQSSDKVLGEQSSNSVAEDNNLPKTLKRSRRQSMYLKQHDSNYKIIYFYSRA